MRTRRARLGAFSAAIALIGSLLVAFIATAPIASANTTQNNGCLGVTGTFSQFAVPITGAGTPNPDTLPGAITLGGTSVQISVDSALIAAGLNTGLVTAAPSLAAIGTSPSLTAPNGVGVNAVTAAVGDVKLKINGTNTVEGVQTATNTAPVALTFYVVQDPSSLVVTVYTAISTAPSTTPDPTRTGTMLIGALPVLIPLGNTVWTPSGGNVVFSEQNIAPSNLLTPTAADQAAAPLILLPKINGAVNVPFKCWPGTVAAPVAPATSSPLTPGASSPIDTVVVNAPATAPTCTGGSATVGGNQTLVIDLTLKCTDVNGNWIPAGTGYPAGVPPITIIAPTSPTTGVPCTAFPCNLAAGNINTTATPGVYLYTNTNPNAPAEGFGFVATDATGLSSAPATFLITILGNLCDATSAPCSLGQILTLSVTGSTMTLEQTSANVTMSPVTLNGLHQISSGALQQLKITNRRGTSAGWSVTGAVTDLKNSGYTGTGCNTLPAAPQPYDRNCIPANNMAWGPSSAIAHTVIPGDVAQVVSGVTGNSTTPWTTPLNSSSTLCSSPANHSGGTFTCDASLWLGVPASAGAGTYTGTITLTLA